VIIILTDGQILEFCSIVTLIEYKLKFIIHRIRNLILFRVRQWWWRINWVNRDSI